MGGASPTDAYVPKPDDVEVQPSAPVSIPRRLPFLRGRFARFRMRFSLLLKPSMSYGNDLCPTAVASPSVRQLGASRIHPWRERNGTTVLPPKDFRPSPIVRARAV